jgi:hypothetical protein
VSDGEVESIKPWASTLRTCWQRCRSQGIVVMMIRYRVLRFARLTSTNRGMQFKGGKRQSIDFLAKTTSTNAPSQDKSSPLVQYVLPEADIGEPLPGPLRSGIKEKQNPLAWVRKARPETPKMVKYVVVTS